MRKILFIPLLFISLIVSATNYHFANAGNDVTGNGSIATPYQTITKLNTLWTSMSAGDSVVFHRGDTFTGTITVGKAGTIGNTIKIGAYSTGADPIISGFTTLSSWTDLGGHIFSKVVTCASLPNMVTVDGVNKAMGRYPDATWMTIDSHTTNTIIVDAAMGASPDWDGADIVVRKNRWVVDKGTISNHTGTSITYSGTSSLAAQDGWGYFIQNDLDALTANLEWYYNTATSTFYMYFAADNPTDYVVKVASTDNNIYISLKDYITIDNLTLEGANAYGIRIIQSSDITVQNSTIRFIGDKGIYGSGGATADCENVLINNNSITDCNNIGIHLGWQFTNGTISNNTISNSGTIVGAGADDTESYIGIVYGLVYTASNTATIQYNTITNSGYCGIRFYGTNFTVDKNLISTYCTIKDDGGGIYTINPVDSESWNYADRVISNNIVLNGIGNYGGTSGYNYGMTHGIYTDDNSNDVTIDSNSVYKSNYSGMYVHHTSEAVITNNIFSDARISAVMFWQSSTKTTWWIRNATMTGNIFVAKGSAQLAAWFLSVQGDQTSWWTTSDNNYFARPVDDDNVFRVYDPGATPFDYSYTLAQWQTYSSQDAASNTSPISIADTSDIDFYYNFTDASVVQALPYASIDMAGTKYAANYTIKPYYSVVLLKDPDPDADPPDMPTVTTTAIVYSAGLSAVVGGNCTHDGGGTVSAKGVCYNTTGSPTTASSKTTNGTGEGVFTSTLSLSANTTYYVKAYATNELGTSYGYELSFRTGKFVTHLGKKVRYGGKYLIIR